MILHRLLDAMFRHGVGFVTTSNFAPDDLYPDGLHRDRVLPAIELLKQQLELIQSIMALIIDTAHWFHLPFTTARLGPSPMLP